MDHRLRTTALVAVAVTLLVGVFAVLPSAPAQGGASITPRDDSPNLPWKIESIGSGVKYRRADFMKENPAEFPWMSAFHNLALNFSYTLNNPTGTLPEIVDGGFYFTINGQNPTDSNAQRCNTHGPQTGSALGTPFPCMLQDGGYCPGAPSQACPQQNNGTSDTVTTQLVPNYSEIGPGSPQCGNPSSLSGRTKICTRHLRLVDGGLPADGTPVIFMVKVRWDSQTTTPETLTDSNGGAFYRFQLDTRLPNGTLSTLAGAYNKKSDRIEVATNTRTPLLEFNFTDPSTGSGIAAGRIKIVHGTADNSSQYETVSSGPFHAVLRYSFAAGKGHPFKANAVTQVHAVVVDKAGNANDHGKGITFKGWNLTVDTLVPSISNDRVTTPGNKTTVAPGAQFEVQANVTDNLIGVQRVHAVLFNASRSLWSDEFVLEPVTGQAKTFRNTTVAVPTTWPDAQVSVQVNATDKVGNRATKLAASLALDTKAPAITVTPVAQYVRTGPYLVRATVLDNGTGIDPSTVTLLFKVGSAAEQSRTMVNLDGGQYSAEIPDQPDGSVLSYRVRAKDKSGGETTTLARGFVVDKAGPTIGLSPETDFVGAGPYQLGAVIADAGAGVDDDPAPSLKWRAGSTGTFTTETMTKGAENLWTAEVPDQPEGGTIHYYIEATDVLGNRATKGTSAAPLTLTVDKTAPTFNLTVPRTVTEPKFEISWAGEDAVSGVATYTVEFRESTRDDWIRLPDLTNTTATSYDFCAAGGKSYEFRGWATDRAGNTGSVSETPMATVQVNSDRNCVAPPNVALQYPNGDEQLSGDVVVLWAAASPQFGPELDITLQVSGDKERWSDIEGARGVANSGSHTWATAETVADGEYWLRVRAVDPNGLVGVDESDATFTVDNGIAVVGDTDNDGLPDDWEREHFGTLSQGARGDADGDGYSNLQEFLAGTNPARAASNPGGAAPQWSEAYWLVLALFAAVLVVTVLGFATRW